MENLKITCVKSLNGFTIDKSYEVLTSKLTIDFNKLYLISDNGTKISFTEHMSEFFVVRKILNSKLSLHKDKNIFDIEFHEIEFGKELSPIHFDFFKIEFVEIGSDLGSTFRTYSNKNGKTISFVKNTIKTWKCVHNDFYLNFNPERPIDYVAPDLTCEPNFITEMIDADIASGRFSYENVKNKIC